MKFNDAVIGAFFVAFALAVILYSKSFPQFHGQQYGPNLFPILVGAGLLACGLLLIAKGYKERISVAVLQLGSWASSRAKVLDLLLLLGSIVFYIFLSEGIGFIPISLLILAVLLFRLGSSITKSLVIATIATLAIHTVFAKFLLVPLPWGVLSAVAW